MTVFRKVAGKALATLGIAGLAVAGLAGAAFANGQTPPLNTINPEAVGSLTVHKKVGTKDENIPLNGVGFTLYKCDNDLADENDWANLTCVNPTKVDDELFTATDGTVTFPNLAVGLYQVKETTLPTGVNTAIPDFLVTIPYPDKDAGTWEYNVDVYPKNEIEGEGKKEVTGVNGHTSSYKLTSPVLGSVSSEDSEGLPASSTSVTLTDNIGECMTNLTNVKGVAIVDGVRTDLTGVEVSSEDSVYTISYSWTQGDYPAGTVFEFTYNTTVKADLTECDGVVENSSSWGKDDTYWGKVDLTKVDAKNKEALDGAEFALYAGACPTTAEELTGDPVEEHATVNGAWESAWYLVGTGNANETDTVAYCVVETKAPTGYVLPEYKDRNWTVNLGAGAQSVNGGVAIPNTQQEGPELPTTGASGTVLMVAGGVGLVALAGGLYLVTRRKTA